MSKKKRSSLTHKYPTIRVKWQDHWENDDDGVRIEDAIRDTLDGEFIGEFSGALLAETFPKQKTKGMICLTSNIWADGTCTRPMYISKKCIIYRSDKQ
jgi:hypothetical protein